MPLTTESSNKLDELMGLTSTKDTTTPSRSSIFSTADQEKMGRSGMVEEVDDGSIMGSINRIVKKFTPPTAGEQRSIDKARETNRERAFNDYINANTQDGVALDVTSGAPVMERIGASFRNSDKRKEVDYWKGLYGEEAVRRLNDDSIAVRVERDGKPLDIRVDEKGATIKDIADIASIAPEVAGDFAAAILLKRFAAGGAVSRLSSKLANKVATRMTQALAAGVGSQTAGLASDVMTDTIDDEEIDFWNKLEKRSLNIPVESAADLTFSGLVSIGGKTLSRMADPMGKARRKAMNAQFAQDVRFLNEYTKENFTPTLGQETQDRMLIKLESLLGQVPGGAQDTAQLVQAQRDALGRIQHFLVGGAVEPDRVVSENTVDRLRQYMANVEDGVQMKEDQVIRLATQETLEEFDRLTMGERVAKRDKYVLSTKASLENQFDKWKRIKDAKYEAVKQLPEYDEYNIDLDPLANYAKQQLKKGKAKFEVTTIDPDTLVQKTQIKHKDLPEFNPPAYMSILQKMASLKGGKGQLQQLLDMRNDLYKLVDESTAMGGVKDAHIKELAKEISNTIDASISKLPNGQLKSKLLDAQNWYKDHFWKFQQKGIAKMLLPLDSPFAGDARRFFTSLYSDPDAYIRLRDILGPNSQQFQAVKRTILDDLLAQSSASSLYGGTVKGDVLLRLIEGATGPQKLIIEDILPNGLSGRLKAALYSAVRAREKNPTRWAKHDLRVPLDQIMQDVQLRGTPTVMELKRLLAAQERQDLLYRNNIIAALSPRVPNPTNINASEFIDKFVRKSDLNEFKQVWNEIIGDNPALKESIRRKAIQDYFLRASEAPTARDLWNDLGVTWKGEIQRSDRLQKAIGNETQREVFEFIVQPETMKAIDAYVRVRRVVENADNIAKMAGALVGGSIINNLMQNPVTGVYKMGVYKLYSITLRSKIFNWVARGHPVAAENIDDLTKFVATAAIFSETGLEALIEEFGEDAVTIKDRVKEWTGYSWDQIRAIVKESENLTGEDQAFNKEEWNKKMDEAMGLR